ncbi:SGNH/GDSL hydrolase family protein [Massilia pseudoviolaceinigra]|uniref:SGNH/GDSL hydrolase family protein n=1 Tax=Massilia pseudoviolaceinigra TaxID=3057165 RepID=UPI002796CF76|nr:SGNH/GDSL hydrolase family protein [Massilia sp. CCM 9206]MDQ1919908.1 SGNH/GDSL hydrolase family protein [Massilia sp. CCM 9206]
MSILRTLPVLFMLCVQAAAASPTRWVASWGASPQARWDDSFILPVGVPASLEQQSVRDVVRLSVGGRRLRIVLSNRYGVTPLQVGQMRVGLAGDGTAVVGGSSRAVTFGGSVHASAAPGAALVSDPVDLPAGALARLAITTYYPAPTPVSTFHWGAQQTPYLVRGNATAAADLPAATRFAGRAFLSAVLVEAPAGARSVVVLGDSITDGNGSARDQDRRWTDVLAQRLAPAGVGVVNAGISGARLLGDRMGANALARLDQDVLAQPGVASVIVMMGINDIGWPGSPFAPHDAAMSAEQVISALRQLIERARAHNVRIVGATLIPFEGALAGTPFEGHYSLAKEAVRQRVNRWIVSGGQFDAVFDADAVLRDPARPSRMRAEYDSGDHLHPGDAGYRALAQALDLSELMGKSERCTEPDGARRRPRR